MGTSHRCLLPLSAGVLVLSAVVAAHAGPPQLPPASPKSGASKSPAPKAGPSKTAPPKSAASKANPKASGGAATTKGASGSPAKAKQDTKVRRQVAGGPTFDDASAGADTPELRALHAAERELFPPASPAIGNTWPDELPLPVTATPDRPRVHASGLATVAPPRAPAPSESNNSLGWLAKLELPDIPVRWDARVIKYLEFFKDDPRGRATLTTWLRRSGRYRDAMRKTFRKKGLPEDLIWLSMIESGFEPTARSPVGAVGLWQFMPETGKVYGLSEDRWADTRMSLGAATEAAADFLADLHRRFGSWDLAMAGYNMGYGGVLSVVRRYNTNDYWALSKLEGSLPWETTLYVPKILAAAVVSRNLGFFGYQDVVVDAPLEGEEILVAPGTALATVATACGVPTKDIEQRNPELRASRTPPAPEEWHLVVPVGKSAECTQRLAKGRADAMATERYVVRFGESLEQIAEARRVPIAKLVELNAISQGEVLRGGMTLLVPKMDGTARDTPAEPKKSGDKPVAVIPTDVFVYPERHRVFYRVQIGDTVGEICKTFKISPDELRRWNEIDSSARLVEGMTLQIFAPSDADLSKVVVLSERDVRIVVAGTDDFFYSWDDKGRKRVVVIAAAGDTLESIGKKHGVTPGLMERINRRSRSEALAPGERVVLWVPSAGTANASQGSIASVLQGKLAPQPTTKLTTPPAPDALPPLP